jgi:hypothetical protein
VFVVAKTKKMTLKLSLGDQPGRLAAVTLFAPTLMYKGAQYDDPFIRGFGLLLFCWDLYWLVCKAPVTSS